MFLGNKKGANYPLLTQLLWEAIMGETPNKEKDMQWEDEFGKGDNYPAYRISYKEVETFIGK